MINYFIKFIICDGGGQQNAIVALAVESIHEVNCVHW